MKRLERASSVGEMIVESGDSVERAKKSKTTSKNIHCIKVHSGVNKNYIKISFQCYFCRNTVFGRENPLSSLLRRHFKFMIIN